MATFLEAGDKRINLDLVTEVDDQAPMGLIVHTVAGARIVLLGEGADAFRAAFARALGRGTTNVAAAAGAGPGEDEDEDGDEGEGAGDPQFQEDRDAGRVEGYQGA